MLSQCAVLVITMCWGSIQCVEHRNRPVIGILAQESKPWDPNSQQYGSYISASYVKAVEASGARVVPVFIDKPSDYYTKKVMELNGFLFPGGAANITSRSGYARSGRIVYEAVSQLKSRGDSVPILGVCLGMELLGLITSGKDLRTECPVKNEALSLKFEPGYRNSSLYRHASEEDIETLTETNSTSNHHRYCLTQQTFNIKSVSQWKILSTSQGAHSGVFISSMEMTDAPVAALIFHPEKNAYEWKSSQANPHDARSIAAARLFYDWLRTQSKINNHSYSNVTQLTNDLIYNYIPVFTGKQGLYDYQNYYFK